MIISGYGRVALMNIILSPVIITIKEYLQIVNIFFAHAQIPKCYVNQITRWILSNLLVAVADNNLLLA
jgi:hypothetical protein